MMSTPHCTHRKHTTFWAVFILTIVWSIVWLCQIVPVPPLADDIARKKVPCPSQNLSLEDAAKSMEDDWYVVEMRKTNLHRSVTHQIKFHTKKHSLLKVFPKEKLYSSKTRGWASVILNDEYAYL
jgi:hypothetical protein